MIKLIYAMALVMLFASCNYDATDVVSEVPEEEEISNIHSGSVDLMPQNDVDAFVAKGYIGIAGHLSIGDTSSLFTSARGESGMRTLLTQYNRKDSNNYMRNPQTTTGYRADYDITNISGTLHFVGNTSLTNLNGLENIVRSVGSSKATGNTLLSSYCGLNTLFTAEFEDGVKGFNPEKDFETSGNAYNPTLENLTAGICEEEE